MSGPIIMPNGTVAVGSDGKPKIMTPAEWEECCCEQSCWLCEDGLWATSEIAVEIDGILSSTYCAVCDSYNGTYFLTGVVSVSGLTPYRLCTRRYIGAPPLCNTSYTRYAVLFQMAENEYNYVYGIGNTQLLLWEYSAVASVIIRGIANIKRPCTSDIDITIPRANMECSCDLSDDAYIRIYSY